MPFKYLTNLPLDQAREKYMDFIEETGFIPGCETVPVQSSCGRITAGAVYARICAPHYAASAMDGAHTHGLYSDGNAPQSVFCHLLQHLRENDKNVLGLLSCENNALFLRYFKDSLDELVRSQVVPSSRSASPVIPLDFLINHISGSFVEMVLWWIQGDMRQTPEELDRYFRAVIEPVWYIGRTVR